MKESVPETQDREERQRQQVDAAGIESIIDSIIDSFVAGPWPPLELSFGITCRRSTGVLVNPNLRPGAGHQSNIIWNRAPRNSKPQTGFVELAPKVLAN